MFKTLKRLRLKEAKQKLDALFKHCQNEEYLIRQYPSLVVGITLDERVEVIWSEALELEKLYHLLEADGDLQQLSSLIASLDYEITLSKEIWKNLIESLVNPVKVKNKSSA